MKRSTLLPATRFALRILIAVNWIFGAMIFTLLAASFLAEEWTWKALGVGLLDRLAGHSPVNISAKSLTVQGGSEFGSFAGITGGPINIKTTGDRFTGNFDLSGGSGFGSFGWVLSSQDINLDIGGKLKLDSGSGFLSFARIQTIRPTSKIRVYFPNLSSGGYFVNGVEGAYRNGLSGFYTGPLAAKPGKGLLVDYGM